MVCCICWDISRPPAVNLRLWFNKLAAASYFAGSFFSPTWDVAQHVFLVSFSRSAAWYKWTWTGLGKRSGAVHYFRQACVWGVLSAGKCDSSCNTARLGLHGRAPERWLMVKPLCFSLTLFRRRNTLMWSFREELTTLVSTCAFVSWRFLKNVRDDCQGMETKCWRQWTVLSQRTQLCLLLTSELLSLN